MASVTQWTPEQAVAAGACVEEIQVRGQIIDSLILPKILDRICAGNGTFRIKEIAIGQTPADASYALLDVYAADAASLRRILAEIADHGAAPPASRDCVLETADRSGAFPEGFYSTTNQRTEVRLDGTWVAVDDQEMDCGILVNVERRSARCIPVSDVRENDAIVVGRGGIRIFPEERTRRPGEFGFMASEVSTEKPKAAAIRAIAHELLANRPPRGRTAIVAGPALVHTGSGEFLQRLIHSGYVDVLLAGNALAAHDVEHAMFGTSRGVRLEGGEPGEGGHAHHLRAINRIRRAGNIQRAVETGVLTSGVMHDCVRKGVDFLLAGSIRDDGPLPDVITDVLEAQRLMREKLRGVTFCLMIATTLHSIAVGNLLPAWVKVVCVDINPSTAIKLADRGSFQTMSLVTDVAPFMRALVEELSTLESSVQRAQPAMSPAEVKASVHHTERTCCQPDADR